MKCFGTDKNGVPCGEVATQVDWETPPIFINPEDPDGGMIRPAHCDIHHNRLMERRMLADQSWMRMLGR